MVRCSLVLCVSLSAHVKTDLVTTGHSPISGIVSAASDEFTDLYGLLVRMALTDNSPPALAVRHAISALSYQHLAQRHTANLHQATAVRALQGAIESPMQPMQALQSMAASMLLNLYEVSLPC